jgi:hypothetical protein
MNQTLHLLGYVPGLARLSLLLATCYVLYRHLSVRALPWLAAHYAVTFLFNLFAGQFFDFLRTFVRSTAHVGTTLGYIGVGAVFLTGFIRLLITLLVLSEIACFVCLHCPDIRSKLLSRLASIRTHVNSLGMTLMALTLVKPVTWLVLWICQHSSAA